MAVLKWYGDKWSKAAQKAAVGSTRKIGADIVLNAKAHCPHGVTRNLSRSIAMGATENNAGKVRTPVGFVALGVPDEQEAFRYAMAVENGRRPGKMPPIEALLLWVQRIIKPKVSMKGQTAKLRKRNGGRLVKADEQRALRGIKSDRQAAAIRSVAFLVARAIGRRGLPPRPFMKPAYEHCIPFLLPEYKARLAEALAELK